MGGDWSASHPLHASPLWKGFPVPIGQEAVQDAELVWLQKQSIHCSKNYQINREGRIAQSI
jgi:hypothetical protein